MAGDKLPPVRDASPANGSSRNASSMSKTMSAQPDLGFAKRTVKNRPTSGLGPKTSGRNSGPPQAPHSPEGGGGGGGASEDALPNASELRTRPITMITTVTHVLTSHTIF